SSPCPGRRSRSPRGPRATRGARRRPRARFGRRGRPIRPGRCPRGCGRSACDNPLRSFWLPFVALRTVSAWLGRSGSRPVPDCGYSMRIALAQLNQTVGDFDGNVARIVAAAEAAAAERADVLLTPELAITGYPAADLLLRRAFHAHCPRAPQPTRGPTAGLPP